MIPVAKPYPGGRLRASFMKIEFVSSRKLEAMLEAEFPEYADDSPQAQRWDDVADGLNNVLCRFAGDQEAPDASGEPGFLSSDIFQGYETLNAEFNSTRLMERDALEAMAKFFEQHAPDYSFAITFFLEDSPGMMMMYLGVLRRGTWHFDKGDKPVQTWFRRDAMHLP